MAAYSFLTDWRFDAPLEEVWRAIDAADEYTEWWPSVISYRDLTPDIHGVGARAERVVRGRLPYQLRYTTEVTRYEPQHEIAYASTGDLTGTGRFVLNRLDGQTQVLNYWDVATSGFWLNALAPALKPLFAWNHDWVMAQGQRGLSEWLQRQSTR